MARPKKDPHHDNHALVLSFLRGVLDGSIQPDSHRMKAAELLGKQCGLFMPPRESGDPPQIIDDL